jgi:hypothetical protein
MQNNIQKHTERQNTPKLSLINKTALIGIFILCAALFVDFSVYAEDSIRYFDEKFAVSLFSDYYTGAFRHDDSEYVTGSPLNIGLGFRYKSISASVSFPIPFKASSFDLEINPYFDKIYYYAHLKFYQDFYRSNTNEKSGLDILSSAITATYVVNHENHSLSSVIDLDKKQTVSSGSFLYAAGTFFSSIYSTDETMNNYNEERQTLIYSGPGAGYSYIWVFDNDMFLNVSMVVFAAMGFNLANEEWLIIPQLEPKIVFGQHKNTWSFNVKIANNSSVILLDIYKYDILTLGSIAAVITKRF